MTEIVPSTGTDELRYRAAAIGRSTRPSQPHLMSRRRVAVSSYARYGAWPASQSPTAAQQTSHMARPGYAGASYAYL